MIGIILTNLLKQWISTAMQGTGEGGPNSQHTETFVQQHWLIINKIIIFKRIDKSVQSSENRPRA